MYIYVLPCVLTYVLAARPRRFEVDANFTQSGAGCGQWMTALTKHPHRYFFQQLVTDLRHRSECKEKAYRQEGNLGSDLVKWQPVGQGCPRMIQWSGKDTSVPDVQDQHNCIGFCFPFDFQYNYTASTKENYINIVDEDPWFHRFRTYAVHRKLDYGYHAHYNPVRSIWQQYWTDKVVQRAPTLKGADACELQATPWIIFTSGAMGVGKGYVMNWMSDRGYFGIESVVHADPDFFKSVMPEKEKYLQNKYSAADAATKCHQESAMMAEVASQQAMATCRHIWEDGSLRDAGWYGKRFQDIKQKFPQYRIAIVHIVPASKDQLLQQVKKRAREEGRDVGDEIVLKSWEDSTTAVNLLKSQAHFFARVENPGPGREPRIVELSADKQGHDDSSKWEIFKEKLGATALQQSLADTETKMIKRETKQLVTDVRDGALPSTLEEFKEKLAQTYSDLSGWNEAVSRLWNSLEQAASSPCS